VGWVELLDLAVEEIVVYGYDSPQVVRRLRLMLERLAAVVPPKLAAAARRRHEELSAATGRTAPNLDGARPAPSRPEAGDEPA
jgi:uncharacterized membrane protein